MLKMGAKFQTTQLILILALFDLTSGKNTFDCYNDKCVRGEMYCVKERQRCYNCADITGGCSGDIPRDCDGYCLSEKLQTLEKFLHKANDLIEELQDNISSQKVVISDLKLELYNGSNELINLNDSYLKTMDQLHEVNTKQRICVDDKDALGLSLEYSKRKFFVAVSFAGILLFVVIIFCVIKCAALIKKHPLRFPKTNPDSCKERDSLIRCEQNELEEVKVEETSSNLDQTKVENGSPSTSSVVKEPSDGPDKTETGINDETTISNNTFDLSFDASTKRNSNDSGLVGDVTNCDLHPSVTPGKMDAGTLKEIGCDYQHKKGARICQLTSQISPTNHADDETKSVIFCS